MNLEDKAFVGAGAKMLDTHRFELTIDGFNQMAMLTDEEVIGRCLGSILSRR